MRLLTWWSLLLLAVINNLVKVPVSKKIKKIGIKAHLRNKRNLERVFRFEFGFSHNARVMKVLHDENVVLKRNYAVNTQCWCIA